MPPHELPSPNQFPSGNPWPQQPMPQTPVTPAPPGQPNPAGNTPTDASPKQPRSILFWVTVIFGGVIVLLIIIIVVLAVLQNNKNTPSKVFGEAMTAALGTSSLREQTTNATSTITSQYSLALPKPAVSSTSTITLYDSKFNLKSYGTFQNSYFTYTKLPTSFPASVSQGAHNTWVHLRSSGTLPNGISLTLTNAADSLPKFFGPLPVADVTSPTTQTNLVNDLVNDVFSYQASQVQRSTLNGKSVYVYNTSENISALTSFYKSLAAEEGLNSTAVTSVMKELYANKAATATFYIQPNTSQILRLVFKQGTQTETINYSGQGSVSSSPATSIPWQQFAAKQSALENQASLLQSNNQVDSERKSDLHTISSYLEAYYANSGSYPTLAELNGQVWVSANMQGIDPDVFKDPDSTSNQLSATPAPNVYAYEASGSNGAACNDNDPTADTQIPCTSYTLIATLSSGQQYSVHSYQ